MDSNTFFHDFTSLTERFASLAIRLSQTARAVQETGIPPADDIVEEMKASRMAFAELCAHGVSLAQSLTISPPPRVDTLSSLNDLKLLLQLIIETEQKMKAAREVSQRALALLDRLYALKHRDREVFAPLAECHMRATILRNAIAETPLPRVHPHVEALLQDDNPFRALLTLVEHGEELEDERCLVLQETIEGAFGKPLAIAALRGKLVLLADVAGERARVAAGSSLSTSVQKPHQIKAEPEEPQSPSSVTRLMPETIVEKTMPPSETMLYEADPTTAGAVELPKFPRLSSATAVENQPDPSLRLTAEALVKQPGDSLPESRNEGKETSQELRFRTDVQPGSPDPVEAKIAAPHDVDNNKQSIRLESLTEPLRQGAEPVEPVSEKSSASPTPRSVSSFPPVFTPDPGQDEKAVMDTPARVSPPVSAPPEPVTNVRSAGIVDVFYRFEPEDKAQKIANLILTGAYGLVEEKPAFLRDLVWRLIYEDKLSLAFHVARCLEIQHPEFHPRLPSWLLRAVTIGQRLRSPHGEIARILKEDLVHCEADCGTTGDKEWDLAVELLLIGAALFPAFLAPETRASTILHGVCLDESLSQLSAYCNVIALHGDLLVPLDPLVLKKQGRAQSRESVGFVRRLMGNQETDSRREIAAEQAEPLRVEVVNRHHAVLEEINLCRQVNRSVPLLGSLACCRRAIEHVATLFDPDTPFSADEPSPRSLLNADLSRIPTLVLNLNKQGDVEGIEKPAFTDHLLRLVASGSLKML